MGSFQYIAVKVRPSTVSFSGAQNSDFPHISMISGNLHSADTANNFHYSISTEWNSMKYLISTFFYYLLAAPPTPTQQCTIPLPQTTPTPNQCVSSTPAVNTFAVGTTLRCCAGQPYPQTSVCTANPTNALLAPSWVPPVVNCAAPRKFRFVHFICYQF